MAVFLDNIAMYLDKLEIESYEKFDGANEIIVTDEKANMVFRILDNGKILSATILPLGKYETPLLIPKNCKMMKFIFAVVLYCNSKSDLGHWDYFPHHQALSYEINFFVEDSIFTLSQFEKILSSLKRAADIQEQIILSLKSKTKDDSRISYLSYLCKDFLKFLDFEVKEEDEEENNCI